MKKCLLLINQHTVFLHCIRIMIVRFQIIRKLGTHKLSIAVIQFCCLIIALFIFLIIVCQAMPVIDRIHRFFKTSIISIQKDLIIQILSVHISG